MIKTLTKVGNSHALVLDKAIMQLAGLSEEDKLEVRVDGDSIVVTKVGRVASDEQFDKTAEQVIRSRRKLLKRLA